MRLAVVCRAQGIPALLAQQRRLSCMAAPTGPVGFLSLSSFPFHPAVELLAGPIQKPCELDALGVFHTHLGGQLALVQLEQRGELTFRARLARPLVLSRLALVQFHLQLPRQFWVQIA